MPVYAGFDLGGTQLKYGLIDGLGTLLFKGKSPTPATIDGFLDLVGRLWKELRERSPEPVDAAGFGIPGIYDLRTRKILQSPNFSGLDEFDIYPSLARVLDVPFWIDNDANMAAFGEWAHGAGRGVQSLVLLTVGTGIGGGIILGGRLWQGGCGYAGEVGHITVNPDGEWCNCGRQGCLEAEASATAIVRDYRKVTGAPETITAEEIAHRAEAGEGAARRAYARAGRFLGIGLGILINLLNPEKILLGGGVMASGELLLAPAVAEARNRSYKASSACCAIERASLGNDAGIIGSASWAVRNLAAEQGHA